MEAMRQSWTDDRLDDLQATVNEFRAETRAEFASVHGEFATLRKETQSEFAAVRKEMAGEFAAVRKEMADEFKEVRQEMKAGFDGIQKLITRFMGIMIAALFGLVGSLIGLVAVAVF